MGRFLTSKLDQVGPILTRASKVATRVRHASNPIAKYMYVVDTLDNLRTLLSLGLWMFGQGTKRTMALSDPITTLAITTCFRLHGYVGLWILH